MHEKIFIPIEVYKNKDTDELTKIAADPKSRLEAGSLAAVAAASAAALLCRAAGIAAEKDPGNERIDYIARNAETVRNYMVFLIDEDVKCRGPLLKALKEGRELEIEAARQPAVSIASELINMMSQTLDLTKEACSIFPEETIQYLGECTELAMAAVRSSRIYILNMSDKCSDDTYRYVIRRENEIFLAQCNKTAEDILKAVEAVI